MTSDGASGPGRSVGRNPEPPGVVDGSLADDRPCLKCAYSLQGLAPRGACPECGEPIERSIRQSLFIHSDLQHVARLRRGAKMALGGMLASALGAIASGVLVAALLGAGQPTAAVEIVSGWVIGVAAPLLFLGGWWFLAAGDPEAPDGDPLERPRRITRFAAGAAVVFTLVSTAVAPPAPTPTTMPNGSFVMTTGSLALDIVLGVAGVGLLTAYLVLFFAGVLMVRRMAGRFSTRRDIRYFQRRPRLLMIVGGVVLPLIWAVTIGVYVFELMRASGVAGQIGAVPGPVALTALTVFGMSGCVISVAILALFFLYLGFLDRLRVSLRGAMREHARRAAAADTPPPAPIGEAAE